MPQRNMVKAFITFLFLCFSHLQLSAQTATTTTVTSNNNPSCDNTNITLTATVTPNAATGTVEFFIDGVSLGAPSTLIAGVRSITISSPMAGTYSITVNYVSDDPANWLNSTSAPLTQIVNASPAQFAVTGGGDYCSGGGGLAVGLSNSEASVNYQLQLNGSNIGAPVAGTGGAISFGN